MKQKVAKEIKDLVFKFQTLGIGQSSDGAALIGKAPKVGSQAWLNILYPILSISEVEKLEKETRETIPKVYRDFLLTFSNGMNILSSTLSLYGLRRQINRDIKANFRQPYSIITPNVFERLDNAKENYFFIGGYNWDGSHLYIDTETNYIHCCDRYDCKSRFQWESFEKMLVAEIKRLYTLFDDEGNEINESVNTLPYKS